MVENSSRKSNSKEVMMLFLRGLIMTKSIFSGFLLRELSILISWCFPSLNHGL